MAASGRQWLDGVHLMDERDDQPSISDLVGAGRVADHFQKASAVERRRLRIEAYEMLYGLVFVQLTRKVEARRGHRDCMVSVTKLRPDCLDRFHDDMDAVIDDLLGSAREPIQNMEGWVSSRLMAVTIDAYRRRRGARGALQRPRLPGWLASELRQDKRLMDLALDMLEWVGVEVSAGLHDWPIEVWAGHRATRGDDHAIRSVADDVATVVAAMRKRPQWYDKYVERPMGRKAFPLAVGRPDGFAPADPGRDALEADAAHDARRAELAELALILMRERIARGEDVSVVVVDVVATLFGAGDGSEELDRPPGFGDADDERVIASLADPETRDRIVALILQLLS